MKHRKKLIAFNILIPIIMFILVLVTGLTSSFMNIVTFTLVVGWAIPYLALVLTGAASMGCMIILLDEPEAPKSLID